MMNEKAVDLWRQYQDETDPQSRAMLYQAYLRALESHPADAIASRAVPSAPSSDAA